ncbi:MAG: DUF2948 family protein [Parvularculaceae bacterium]
MTGLEAYRPLRLAVEDAEDVKVLSTVFQDAIMTIGDFAFDPAARRFAFVANRFVWECAGDKTRGVFARVRAGCHFDDVLAVKQLHLRSDAKDAVVDLLSIRFEPGEDGAGAVVLDFAGGGAIRLDVEAVNAEMRDISEPWATRSRPSHDG